jgi:hypothetical protein
MDIRNIRLVLEVSGPDGTESVDLTAFDPSIRLPIGGFHQVLDDVVGKAASIVHSHVELSSAGPFESDMAGTRVMYARTAATPFRFDPIHGIEVEERDAVADGLLSFGRNTVDLAEAVELLLDPHGKAEELAIRCLGDGFVVEVYDGGPRIVSQIDAWASRTKAAQDLLASVQAGEQCHLESLAQAYEAVRYIAEKGNTVTLRCAGDEAEFTMDLQGLTALIQHLAEDVLEFSWLPAVSEEALGWVVGHIHASGKDEKVWIVKVVDGETGEVAWELPEDPDGDGRD